METYRNTIVDVICGVSGPIIDMNAAIETLQTLNILTEEKSDLLKQRFSQLPTNKERLIAVVCEIYKPGNLEFLFRILDVIGLSDIVDVVSLQVRRPIHGLNLPHSKHLQTFYFGLESILDNNNCFDRSDFLKQRSVSIQDSFKMNFSDDIKLKYASRFAVVSWLRIPHCKRDTRVIREVLNEMVAKWPTGIHDSLCQIFYHSKIAIAALLDGDIPSAMEESRISKHLSASFYDPFMKALICHDSIYINQIIFELERSESYYQNILSETETALCFLESDSNGCDNFSRKMKRFFLLSLAQFKLNMLIDLKPGEIDKVSADDVDDAQNAVDSCKRTLNPYESLDLRQKMIYKVCKARIQEQSGNYEKAILFLSEANELSEDGAYFEQEENNIKVYYNKLFVAEKIVNFFELTSEEKKILLSRESGLDNSIIAKICDETGNLEMSRSVFALLINKTIPGYKFDINDMMSFHSLMSRVYRLTEF